MASPTTRANNVWEVNGGDDVLQVTGQGGGTLSGIDATGAGFGTLAGGGSAAGSTGDVQFNNSGAFADADTVSSGSTVNLDSASGTFVVDVPGQVHVTSTGDAMTFSAPGNVDITSTGGQINFNAASPNRQINLLADGMSFQTLDLNMTLDTTNNPSDIILTAAGAKIEISATHVNLPALQIFANNAAAISGGLLSGDAYRTGANPDVVCVVH